MFTATVSRAMNAAFWTRLMPASRHAERRPRLRLQPLGFTDTQVRDLRLICERLGETLDLLLEIDTRAGDLVLADRRFTEQTPAHRLAGIADARPLLTQLRALPLVRGLSPQFGASGWDPGVVAASSLPSGFDDAPQTLDAPPFTPAEDLLVTWVLRGLMAPDVKGLVAAYGPQATMRLDFAQGYALIDPAAQQALRVQRRVPTVQDYDSPGADAIARELPALVWDLGIALGDRRLLDQPADGWHTPLATCKDPSVQQYTRLPRHLELASMMFRARLSPAELQRRSGQSVAEIRPFLQACLFLGLAWWAPEDG
ncbi:hypothetical protein [Rubrivivax albus]|uniref:Uncharacterized protein n=1 Tax=Rubrivivax albus TaxID=2499835 RepID=A0A3S2TP46_9BURK|nr:hypothetical protein [Rubrivivax albus]RVT53347.1 hypothetical protein ENE75_00090 [Rubrivivax albus]